jgi:hypothetical protein
MLNITAAASSSALAPVDQRRDILRTSAAT